MEAGGAGGGGYMWGGAPPVPAPAPLAPPPPVVQGQESVRSPGGPGRAGRGEPVSEAQPGPGQGAAGREDQVGAQPMEPGCQQDLWSHGRREKGQRELGCGVARDEAPAL